MFAFRQKNQRFGTLDLIALIGLCGAAFTSLGMTLAGFLHDSRPARASMGAQAIAEQLRQHRQDALKSVEQTPESRGPASAGPAITLLSAGELGRDPWGHPYHYLIRQSEEGGHTVFVWSNGPDGHADTEAARLPQFGGDDIGVALVSSH